jgi:4-amino-4-deoxy-L-arabinose transferase-like glycosyltransferase
VDKILGKIVKGNKYLLFWIIGISVLLRIGAAVYMGDVVTDLPGTYDQISYHTLAIRVVNGYGFSFGEMWWPLTAANAPTAHWSFLFTLYLAAVYKIFGIHPLAARIIQAIIVGVFQPYLTYLIAKRLFTHSVGLVAAGLSAVYIYFIYYDGTLMTEPFFITAILVGLYFSFRLVDATSRPNHFGFDPQVLKFSLLLGLFLGITVLLRQLYLLIIPFQFLWIWWARYKNQGKRSIFQYLPSVAVIAIMIVPFTFYN